MALPLNDKATVRIVYGQDSPLAVRPVRTKRSWRGAIVAEDVGVISWELKRTIPANGRIAIRSRFQWKRGLNHSVERILGSDRIDQAVSSRGFFLFSAFTCHYQFPLGQR